MSGWCFPIYCERLSYEKKFSKISKIFLRSFESVSPTDRAGLALLSDGQCVPFTVSALYWCTGAYLGCVCLSAL